MPGLSGGTASRQCRRWRDSHSLTKTHEVITMQPEKLDREQVHAINANVGDRLNLWDPPFGLKDLLDTSPSQRSQNFFE